MQSSEGPLDILTIGRRVIQANGAAVMAAETALGDVFVQVCRLLVAGSGKALVTGSGTSGAIAIRAAHLLSVSGTPAFYLSPADGLHGGLGVLRPEDSVIAISKGGSSGELNEFCRRARKLANCLIVITATPSSELAELADYVLPLTLPADADLGAIIATRQLPRGGGAARRDHGCHPRAARLQLGSGDLHAPRRRGGSGWHNPGDEA